MIKVITISDYRKKRDDFIQYNIFTSIHVEPTKTY